jgi:hypothetical protein
MRRRKSDANADARRGKRASIDPTKKRTPRARATSTLSRRANASSSSSASAKSSTASTPMRPTILLHADIVDLLSELSAARARFLVVGGYAVGVHGHPRATKDLDIWVAPTRANARRVLHALRRFGAPPSTLREGDLRSACHWAHRSPREQACHGPPSGSRRRRSAGVPRPCRLTDRRRGFERYSVKEKSRSRGRPDRRASVAADGGTSRTPRRRRGLAPPDRSPPRS